MTDLIIAILVMIVIAFLLHTSQDRTSMRKERTIASLKTNIEFYQNESERVKAQRNDMAETIKINQIKLYKQKLKIKMLSGDIRTLVSHTGGTKEAATKRKWKKTYLESTMKSFLDKSGELKKIEKEFGKMIITGVGSHHDKNDFRKMWDAIDDEADFRPIGKDTFINHQTTMKDKHTITHFKNNTDKDIVIPRDMHKLSLCCTCTIPSLNYGIEADPNCNNCHKPPSYQ